MHLNFISALLLTALASLPALRSATASDLDQNLEALKGYRMEQSRTALASLEKAIRESNPNDAQRQKLEQGLASLLGSSASHEAKLFACRQLWIIGTDASVSAVGKLLDKPDTAGMACLALTRHPSAQVNAIAREALGKAEGSARLSIIHLLGDRRDPEAVKPLAALLESESPEVVSAALSALGRIGNADASRALQAKGRSWSADLARDRRLAQLECADRLRQSGDKESAIALFRPLFEQKEDFLARRSGMIGLIKSLGPQAPQFLMEVVNTATELQNAAIAQIPAVSEESATGFFAAETKKAPAHLQPLLLAALADRGDRAAIPAIRELAGDAKAPVAIAALRALAVLGDATAVPVFARALAFGGEQRAAALEALRRLQGPGVDEAILHALGAAEPAAKPDLIGVVSDRAISGAAPVLVRQVRPGDSKSAIASFRALGQLAGQEEIKPMLDLLLAVTDEAVAEEAETAVIQTLRKLEPGKQAAPVLSAFAEAKNSEMKGALVRVLGAVGDETSFRKVVAESSSSDATVRDAAIRTLAEWPDGRAVSILKELAQQAAAPNHRALAMRGYLRLLATPNDRGSAENLKQFEEASLLARRDDEKRLVLSALSQAALPGSLRLIEPMLSQPEVANEAGLAALAVARQTLGTDVSTAKRILKRLEESSSNETMRGQAAATLRLMEQTAGYLMAWHVCGPFEESGKSYQALFDQKFGPELAMESKAEPPVAGSGPAWQPLPIGADPSNPWILDLAKLFPGNNRVAYARTYIKSNTTQPVQLLLGSDDGIKVWVNGRVVHANNTARAAKPGEDRAQAQLDEGWNAVLVKVTQNIGPWSFCCSVARPNGNPADDLDVSPLR